MATTYKIWTAAYTNTNWSPKLQHFLIGFKPESSEELKVAVESFQGE